MENRFYEVAIQYGDSYYFKNYDNAKECLWNHFMEYCSADYTEEEIQIARDSLILTDEIPDVGWIYYYDFED